MGHNLCQQDHQRLASTRPEEPIFSLEIEFTGRTWQDKVEEIRGALKEKGCEALILRWSDFLFWSFMYLYFSSALDDVAWLFNLRGSDINFNPVFFSYAAVTEKEVFVFYAARSLNLRLLPNR